MGRTRRVTAYSSPSQSGDPPAASRGAVSVRSRLGRVPRQQDVLLPAVAGPSSPSPRREAGKRPRPPPLSPPAKRAPPTPVEEDGPLQLILQEMRRISQRVGALEQGASEAETEAAPPVERPPLAPSCSAGVVRRQPLPGCSSLAPPPPPVVTPAHVPLASEEEEDDWAEPELTLHASGSSDGSLFSPVSGEDERVVEWSATPRMAGECSLLAEVRAAAVELGLADSDEGALADGSSVEGVWAGVPLQQSVPPFPVADGYGAMLRRSWAKVSPTDRYNPGCSVLRKLDYDPVEGLEFMPPVEREIVELTRSKPEQIGDDPVLPNKEDRAADRLVLRAFDGAMRAARVGNLLAISLASARRQAEGLCPHLAATLTSALTLHSQMVRDLGESLSTTVRTRRQLWLRQAPFPVTVKERLIALPVEPGRVFHSSSRSSLDTLSDARQSREKVMQALRGGRPGAPPRRGKPYPKKPAARGAPPAGPAPPSRPPWSSARQPFRGGRAGKSRGGRSNRGGRSGS